MALMLLPEDHRSPVASLQVWYRGGSRNEAKVASFLTVSKVQRLGLDCAERYRREVARVTAADVRRVRARFLVPDRFSRVVAVLLATVVLASAVEAASFVLDEQETGRAMALGQRSVVSEAPFDTEWRMSNASGEVATVVTPFHRIALAARHAAFMNEPLRPSEREKLLREQKDRLPVWVTLRGGREDFARYYAPRLVVAESGGGEREIAPSFVQNERTALRQEGGVFVARCVYGFPTKDLTGTSRGVLLVRDAEGREVSRFAFDLSRMR